MNKTSLHFLIAFSLFAAGAASAQSPAAGPTLHLSAEEAVKMALDANVDLAAARLDPQIGDMRVAAAAGAFKPTFTSTVQRNNQLQPPASFLVPIATRTDLVTSNVGVGQRLSKFGTSYGLAWTTSHTDSNSILSSYNPLVQSGLSLSVSQPLLRDLFTDSSRTQLKLSKTSLAVSDTRLRDSIVHTTADVKRAYWNLVSSRATLEARRTTLSLAEELARVNKAKVDVGQSPPLDEVSAQAEVAADQEQVIVAETAVKQAEDRLRLLIFDPTKLEIWNVALDPVDTPPQGTSTIDLDGAMHRALATRTDIVRAQKDVETAQTNVDFAGNQRLPDVRVSASYLASGLGGTQVLRSGGFPGTVVGPGDVTTFGTVLNQLFDRDYPTWTAGVTVSYPIGRSTEDANFARAKIERTQAAERVKSAEAKVIQQVRSAGWNIEMNAKRIDTTRAARELAEQRLDAEQKRYDVGMSTSFLVIQAQRDLAQATTNELSAVLAYDLSLVDFEALQEAPPSGTSGGN